MTAPTPPAPPRVRASDAERADVVARLHHALGEGRLELDEAADRSALAHTALHRDELPALLADLPGPVPTAPPAWGALWHGAVWRVRAVLLDETDRPDAGQVRAAALLLVVAVLWALGCAVLVGTVLGP